jgi:hypothetical protein
MRTPAREQIVTAFEITAFSKSNGPLTKQISLAPDGSVRSDGSQCVMARGTARRVVIAGMRELAALIGGFGSHEALALGSLQAGLPERVEIATKRTLDKLNGTAPSDLIARTGGYIVYRTGQPALALLDFDTKGIPAEMVARIGELGDYWAALVSVVPELGSAARVTRRSTSAGIYRTDTKEKLPGSDGLHIFVHVQDGSDVERFVTTLHARCWLAGFGWLMVGAGGQLLERSIVDRMVGAPERLIFEGAPVLEPPLAQDHDSRRPIVTDGDVLNTVAACPPLSIVEQAKISELRAREATRLAPGVTKAKAEFIARQCQLLAERTGMDQRRARRVVKRQCAGVLLPDLVLPFDDADLTGSTVADVLADPDRFEGATLADPLEGIEYGRCKARIMRRADGTPWINSFAHGRTIYQLRFDARAAEAGLEKVSKEEAADTFVRFVLAGDLDPAEIERLRDIAIIRSGVGKRALNTMLKLARLEQAELQGQERRERRLAERRDPRPQIWAPLADAPWLPQMAVLNDVLGASRDREPPMRDVEGVAAAVHTRRMPLLHMLTARGTNQDDTTETRLPPPEQPLLTRLSEAELAEVIERHIEYVDAKKFRPVHLAASFVHHFWQRKNDTALPIASAVATMAMVLPDGSVLSGVGLDRQRGIVFRIPAELLALLPKAENCAPPAVGEAMRFLADDWLIDVATDYEGKCILIALALTILERLLLPERPAFIVTAGQRGGGKTTAVHLISLAVLGHRAAAVAWSTSEEERRKALFAFLGAALPLITWDNIARGTAISCPSIEKALTAETYTDRVLGETDYRTVPASTVMVFTGNNIGGRGDLASRELTARLAVDRPDPENRPFAHPDPLAWTEAHRGRILQALYIILLGNPRLRSGGSVPPAETRFKAWHHLIGAAVEHAADRHAELVAERVKWLVADKPACPPSSIRFRDLFLDGETDDEQASSLATVLDIIRTKWPHGCTAAEVAAYAGGACDDAIAFKAAIEAASSKAVRVVTPIVLTWRLKALVEAPTQVGGIVLALRYRQDKAKHGGTFSVERIR